LLKPRKNKSFSYRPRFSKDTELNTEDKESAKNRDFGSKWRNNQGLSNRKIKKGLSLPFLILILALILICMYILDIKFN
jgi:hypothetical protein